MSENREDFNAIQKKLGFQVKSQGYREKNIMRRKDEEEIEKKKGMGA